MSSESVNFKSINKKIANKTALVGVVGLGYVGLPLIDAFVSAGFKCVGFDVDRKKIDMLQSKESYIAHIGSEKIGGWVEREMFVATDDMSRLAEPDAILICVPTPLSASRDPDLRYVISTTESIASVARPGQLVVLESTTYPGTTRGEIVPILRKSGLNIDEQLFVAYSPEREDPGNPKFVAATIPKVVGGIGVCSLRVADALYQHAVTATVPVSSCEVAEACKILENTYRSVNIAMVNELKVLFERIGIDVWEVINAAETKPFGYQAFYPGPGLGGHCIPIDPFYLSWVARKHEMSTRFIELAGEINTSMPRYVIDRVAEALNEQGKAIKGSKICVLGVAYKKDVDDPRESPSFKLMELLVERKAELSYSDPHVPTLPAMRSFDVPEMSSEELTAEFLQAMDCVIIATDHSAFNYRQVVMNSQLVVDTRNATKDVVDGREKIWKA